MIYRLIIFLILNFGALALGGLFTNNGVSSVWYAELNKAPWTPPGWVFGAAWTFIMISFSFYIAYLWPVQNNKFLLVMLFALQWLLNVMWNPVFFYYHNASVGLIIISLLTLLIAFMVFFFSPLMKAKTLLLLPYFLWLIIATSLNAYIFLKN
ncbi:MAG TPA: TspO protein [Flavobacteriales bacterium]|nr:TspO protein [Flavobacteriales bacterium]|tara:strand:+ start:28252 stop:28710 length:459 start_codon:yes stop_codon:yes gene_type:complete